MQHDTVLKKLNFDLLTPSVNWGGGGGGVSDRIFAIMLLLFVIPILICNMTMF